MGSYDFHTLPVMALILLFILITSEAFWVPLHLKAKDRRISEEQELIENSFCENYSARGSSSEELFRAEA